jgi:1-acyl-sn-glycerol-3-phosphate acyltransferase
MTETVQETKSVVKKSALSDLLKSIIKHNPIDPFASWIRTQLKSLGLLEIVDEYVYWFIGYIPIRALFKTLWNYKVTMGLGNMPEYGPVVVVPNHQCEFDPFLVGCAVHRKVAWLSKAENFEYPIYKTIIEPFGTIPIHRGQHDEEAMAKVKALLNAGECVGIFPEGTRSPDGKLGAFHTGAARLCLETGAPFLPVAVIGSYKILPKSKSIMQTKFGIPIEIRVGKAVYLDPNLKPTPENAKIVAEEMHTRIQGLIDGRDLPLIKSEHSPFDHVNTDEIPQKAKVDGDQYADIANDLSIV